MKCVSAIGVIRMQVDVKNLNTITETIKNLEEIKSETFAQCDEGQRTASRKLNDAQNELDVSNNILNVCKTIEAAKLAKKLEVEARMAQAVTAEASAIASGNPVAIAAASAKVAAIATELAHAIQEHNEAVEHRQRIEHRCELAQKCVNIAQEMCDTLNMRFGYSKVRVEEIVLKGSGRLQLAYDDLTKYLSRISPEAKNDILDWYNWKPKENEPVKPNDIRDRLNASKNVINVILEYLYTTDMNFRATVDRHSSNIIISGMESSTIVQIKKNIVGRLCEELVIWTFLPMGTSIETQHRENLPDGSYTKVDMILHGLKQPLVLGKGEGMGAREGGTLGIEVKAGHKEYIYSQMPHLEKQAQGHKMCDVSCTVCTRDIKDLSPDREANLREKVRGAGSPMLGMLPYKDDLDRDCIDFVRSKVKQDV